MVRGSGRRLCTTLVAVGLALQGCASPGRPVTQTVRVETPGLRAWHDGRVLALSLTHPAAAP
jgi:hypothetical protein